MAAIRDNGENSTARRDGRLKRSSRSKVNTTGWKRRAWEIIINPEASRQRLRFGQSPIPKASGSPEGLCLMFLRCLLRLIRTKNKPVNGFSQKRSVIIISIIALITNSALLIRFLPKCDLQIQPSVILKQSRSRLMVFFFFFWPSWERTFALNLHQRATANDIYITPIKTCP